MRPGWSGSVYSQEPTVHLQPTFSPAVQPVPKGSLLTEQLLQMDLELDFTCNTAAAARAPSGQQNHFSSLAAFKHRLCLKCFYGGGVETHYRKILWRCFLCILSQLYSQFPASPNDGVSSAHDLLCFPSAPKPAVCRYGLNSQTSWHQNHSGSLFEQICTWD